MKHSTDSERHTSLSVVCEHDGESRVMERAEGWREQSDGENSNRGWLPTC